MSNLVTNIVLWNASYTVKLRTIPVQDKIVLPQYLDDDSPGQPVQAYELMSQVIAGTSGNIEAHYYMIVPVSSVMRTALSYLVPGMSTSVVYAGQTFTLNPMLGHHLKCRQVAGLDMLVNTGFDPGGATLGNAEPPCRCNIRALTSSGHESGCAWKAWKDSK